MSCPTWICFKNDVEGVEKRIFANLGWVTPTQFQLAQIIIDAAKELPEDFEWHKLRFINIAYGYMTKESFDDMILAVDMIRKQGSPEIRKRFTLEKMWLSE